MKFSLLLVCLLSISGCSNWIYRIDVPQGNYLEQKEVDQLRIGMNKEQVAYVLGNPVVGDSFNHDTWYYVYKMKRGMRKNGEDFRKELIVQFNDGKVSEITGDFELSEDFNIPLDQ